MDRIQFAGSTIFVRELEEKLNRLFEKESRIFSFQLYVIKELENSTHTLRVWPRRTDLYIGENNHSLKVLYLRCNVTISTSSSIGRVVRPQNPIELNIACNFSQNSISHITDIKGTILKFVNGNFKQYAVYGYIKEGELVDFITDFEEIE